MVLKFQNSIDAGLIFRKKITICEL